LDIILENHISRANDQHGINISRFSPLKTKSDDRGKSRSPGEFLAQELLNDDSTAFTAVALPLLHIVLPLLLSQLSTASGEKFQTGLARPDYSAL
jgi:hypothetical protein